MQDHHPKFAPSGGLPRALLCSGSVELIAMLRAFGFVSDDSSPAAEEGVLLHSRLPEWTSLDDLTVEQADQVQKVRQFIAARVGDNKTYYEYPLKFIHDGEVLTFGTADCLAVVDRRVIVVDAKFGRLEPKEVFLTVQGATYTAMAMREFGCDSGEFHAVVPRLAQTHSETHDNIDELESLILRIIRNTEENPHKLQAGEQQCTYCPALGFCREAADTACMALNLPSGVEAYPPEQLATELNLISFVENWSKKRKKCAVDLIRAGAHVPYWGIQEVAGRRKITDPGVARMLASEYVPPEELEQLMKLPVGELEEKFCKYYRERIGCKVGAALQAFSAEFEHVIEQNPPTYRLVRVKEER